MPVYPQYFDLVARKGIKGKGSVIFKEITLERAKELWLGGYEYLRLNADGAIALFGESTIEQRIDLLSKCTTPTEVQAIMGIPGNTHALRSAADMRLKELLNEDNSATLAGETEAAEPTALAEEEATPTAPPRIEKTANQPTRNGGDRGQRTDSRKGGGHRPRG